MKKATLELISELKQHLEAAQWKADRYGNYRKSTGTQEYRVKFNPTSIRIEAQVIHSETQYSPQTKEWVKIDGSYYKDLKKNDKQKIVVGKYAF